MSEQFLSLKDHVYDHIASRIEAGDLSVGDHVSEQSICSAMGVSRTPVREALILLAADGYLDNEPRKGFRVHGFNKENAEEVFEILGPLDGEAAYLACDNLLPEDFAQMHFLIDSMDLAINNTLFKNYDDLQKTFHETYFNRCNNSRLIKEISTLLRHFSKREYSNLDQELQKELLRKANAEHKEILRLLEEGDKHTVRNYICDVHWDITNAEFTVW